MKILTLVKQIRNKATSGTDRIEAIQMLGEIRSLEREQWQSSGKSRVIALGEDESPSYGENVQIGLQQVIQDSGDAFDVRCHAAAMIAQTDIQSALKWCSELLDQYTPPEGANGHTH